VESKDRTKAMWQLINRVTGKAQKENVKLELRIGDQITLNPTEITQGLNIRL
jgi:translation initiation factor IF-1